jgi:hypothetical protein
MNKALTHFYWYGYAAMFLFLIKDSETMNLATCAVAAVLVKVL